jgi:hypothetical protein
MEERTRETHTFLITCCGASKVEMIVDYGDDLAFVADASYEERPKTSSGKLNAKRVERTNRHAISEAPGRSAPGPLIPSEWIWFAAEPEWQEIHRQRRDAGITSYNLTTVVKDDRSVDFKALAKLGCETQRGLCGLAPPQDGRDLEGVVPGRLMDHSRPGRGGLRRRVRVQAMDVGVY